MTRLPAHEFGGSSDASERLSPGASDSQADIEPIDTESIHIAESGASSVSVHGHPAKMTQSTSGVSTVTTE